MTTDQNPDRGHRAVLTVTAISRPDGGNYFDQADFAGHVTEWVRAGLLGKHAVDEVTITAAPPTQADEAEALLLRFAAEERGRYHTAWRSARMRAQAYGEGVLLHVAQRDFWQMAAEQNYAAGEEQRLALSQALGLGTGAPWAAIRERAAELAVLPAPVDQAAVLEEAAQIAVAENQSCPAVYQCQPCLTRERVAADLLRAAATTRRLAEAPQPETQAGPVEQPPVCEGFQWIGQSFATCDRCGHPAWDHQGEDVAAEGAGPFDGRRTVRLWEPGEADRIRAKWGAPAVVAQPICKCPAELCHCDHGAVVAQPGKEG